VNVAGGEGLITISKHFPGMLQVKRSLIYRMLLDEDPSKRRRVARDEEAVAIALATHFSHVPRNKCIFRKRWDSYYLRDLAEKEKSFLSEYRLDPGGFDLLHEMLSPRLTVNELKASASNMRSGSGDIGTDSRLGAALIMLAGGRFMEAMRTHGLSRTFVDTNLLHVCEIINSHPGLKIECPNDMHSLRKRAESFRDRGDCGLFEYSTGVIDGLVLPITCPRQKQGDGTIVLNTKRFYSGSKLKYSINMQGVCDSNLLFIAVTAKHVGSTFDGEAFETSSLKDICTSVPFPFHWLGDAAYTLSQWMMIPWPGTNLHTTSMEKESFNFWHSQLRITIERCFGVFIARWGIFWHPMKKDLKTVFTIIHACCRLHNFCQRRNLPVGDTSYNRPHYAETDNVTGRLRDDVWRNGAEPNADWREERDRQYLPINSLRSEITDKIREEN